MSTNNHTAILTGASNAPATVNTPLGTLDAAIGDLTGLPTTPKTSVAGAIGGTALGTTATTLSGAIAEIVGDVDAVESKTQIINSTASVLTVSGGVDASALSINGTPVGSSTDTYWGSTPEEITYNTVGINGGVVATGTVAGMNNVYRTDASFTVNRASGHAMIDLYYSGTGVSGAGSEESVVNFSMKDDADGPQQLGSVSMIWAQADAGDFISQMRLHANSSSGGSNSDFRLTSGRGCEFFGILDTAAAVPGGNTLRINGTIEIAPTQYGSINASLDSSIYLDGANRTIFRPHTSGSGFFFQNAAASITILELAQATGSVTIYGDVTATNGGFTTGGGSAAAYSMRKYSTYLLFQGGSSGYLFQNTANSATIITAQDGGEVGIGVTPTAYLDVQPSTTSKSGFRLRGGSTPTAPNTGDMWFDGTNLKFYDGSATRTITWT